MISHQLPLPAALEVVLMQGTAGQNVVFKGSSGEDRLVGMTDMLGAGR